MLSPLTALPSTARRTRSLLVGLALVGASLAMAPTVSANPAAGPGAVSRVTAGALAAGTVPDGTCAAQVAAVGGGGASSPVAAGFGGTGAAGASISATFRVLPGQSFGGSVGGGGTNPNGGSGAGAVGTGGDGGSIVVIHQGGGGGGRTSVDLGGSTVLVAGGGGGGGAAHQNAPAGVGGGGGFAGIGAGTVAVGSDGQTGVDAGGTANGGTGGQAAAGGAGGTNTGNAALNGTAGGGIGTGTGGNGGPDPNYDSGAGGGGGYTGGGGGSSTVSQNVSGGGGGGGSSWVSAASPNTAGSAPTAISGAAGPASPAAAGPGEPGSIAIDWLPCLYGLTVTKAVSSPTVAGGGAVVWTVTVTNNGPSAMTRGDTVTLTDLLPPGPNGGPGPDFEVLTFTVAGGVNTEMTRGPVTCSGLSVGSSMPASTICSRAYSAPGAAESPSGGLRGLDPGETITITYRQVIADTAPCSTITNTASVQDRATQSGTTDTVGVIATRSDTADLTITCLGPGISLAKTASRTTFTTAGTVIDYEYVVTNIGSVSLAGPVVVTDDKTTVTCPALTTVGDNDTDLDPGESVTCTASYTVTAADVAAHRVTNIATAAVDGVTSNVESATVRQGVTVTSPPTNTGPGSARGSRDTGLPFGVAWLMLVSIGVLIASQAMRRRMMGRVGRKP